MDQDYLLSVSVLAIVVLIITIVITHYANTNESLLRSGAQIIYKKYGLCSTMVAMRKVGVFLFSVVLFISLLGLALSVSSSVATTHPQKIKSWLNQSNVYGAFVTDAINQAKQSAGDDSDSSSTSSGISLNDTAVQQIARSTFSSKTLQGDVDTFVNSNYDWLKGKSTTPSFKVDLTSAKQTFANKVGDYVQTYLTNLPVCSDAQLSDINVQDANPLNLTCRPAGVLPSTISAQVSEDISSSNAFLSNPVITATNLDPKGDTETTPYYQNLSGLPKVYQFGTKLPLIAGVIALASFVGVVFVAKRHRGGLKVAAIVLTLAGLILLAIKLVSGQIFDHAQQQLLSGKTGEVHKALTTFLHYVMNQLVAVDLWFGIGYLVAAIVIFIALRSSRRRLTPSFLKSDPRPARNTDEFEETPRPAPVSRPTRPPIGPDDELRLKNPGQPTTAPPVPKTSSAPRRRKPPKLVQ
jgi:hypothetical protein